MPGHESSAVITAIGKDVQDFEVGEEVYGMNDWYADGAIDRISEGSSCFTTFVVGFALGIRGCLGVNIRCHLGTSHAAASRSHTLVQSDLKPTLQFSS